MVPESEVGGRGKKSPVTGDFPMVKQQRLSQARNQPWEEGKRRKAAYLLLRENSAAGRPRKVEIAGNGGIGGRSGSGPVPGALSTAALAKATAKPAGSKKFWLVTARALNGAVRGAMMGDSAQVDRPVFPITPACVIVPVPAPRLEQLRFSRGPGARACARKGLATVSEPDLDDVDRVLEAIDRRIYLDGEGFRIASDPFEVKDDRTRQERLRAMETYVALSKPQQPPIAEPAAQ